MPMPSPSRRPILLRWEDERSLLRKAPPAIVPFLMEEREEKGEPVLSVEAYRGTKPYLASFFIDHDGRFFGDAALRALHAALLPYFEKTGYRIDGYGMLRYYFAYRLESGRDEAPAPRPVPGVSVLLPGKAEAALPCALTLSPPLLHERRQRRADLPFAVAIENGRILSVAAVGDAEESSRVREITVETAPGARGRGLGTAVCACLAAELLRQGLSCAYCCSRRNRASRKIVLSLGFRPVGRFYAVSGYRE